MVCLQYIVASLSKGCCSKREPEVQVDVHWREQAGGCRRTLGFSNPEQKVHFIPLGPNAVKVWIEVVKVTLAEV